jgi:hypothetical protein
MEILLNVVWVGMQSLQEQSHHMLVRVAQAFGDHRRQALQDKYTRFGAFVA